MSEESKSEKTEEASLKTVFENLKASLSDLSANIRDTIVYLGRLRESIQDVMEKLPSVEIIEKLTEAPKPIPTPEAPVAPYPPPEPVTPKPVEPTPAPEPKSLEPPKPEKPISIPAPPTPTVHETPTQPQPVKSTVKVDTTTYLVNEILNEVVKLAQGGTPGSEVAKKLIAARDKIMQKVPYSLAYHEMRSFASKLEELKTSPLPSGILTELIEKVEEWKRRLAK